VRWELDAHGYSGVKIFLSGGVTREDVVAYHDIVDAFGVGGAIANAPVIDFGMDIVEIEGRPKAKRGKRSGVKQVYALPDASHCVLPVSHEAPPGGIPLLERVIDNGRIVKQSDMQEARARVAESLALRKSSQSLHKN
jgi:nicotinate phosphoribosyltransferase